jgi:hypothetical protein
MDALLLSPILLVAAAMGTRAPANKLRAYILLNNTSISPMTSSKSDSFLGAVNFQQL